ncbi:MAG: cysteine--tRNA ligase, partial [Bacteroidia bacterium]|nr:cysteine--tRNA ligase [Bacteroidia bacterium]
QFYTDRFQIMMDKLRICRPNIEPRATGHIPEQIAMIAKILENGYAYIENGSVYFDVEKYAKDYSYGILSGRTLENTVSGTRELDGQQEKRNPHDFALWKKATPGHIMQWDSPWSKGFPGWHIECSAMSTKYLGDVFDIHGGGMDLLFPHHEAEIAQANACQHPNKPVNEAKYWMHCNMITINNKKMGKSYNNFINLEQFFTGNHELLTQAYTPMTIRFFMLQTHYRSTLDFSNEALQAAEKGYKRMMQAMRLLPLLKPSATSSFDWLQKRQNLYDALNDDLNTAIAIAELFEIVRIIHAIHQGTETVRITDLQDMQTWLPMFVSEILGLVDETDIKSDVLDKVMKILLELRQTARLEKNYALSDKIRNALNEIGISVKDTPNGSEWFVS